MAAFVISLSNLELCGGVSHSLSASVPAPGPGRGPDAGYSLLFGNVFSEWHCLCSVAQLAREVAVETWRELHSLSNPDTAREPSAGPHRPPSYLPRVPSGIFQLLKGRAFSFLGSRSPEARGSRRGPLSGLCLAAHWLYLCSQLRRGLQTGWGRSRESPGKLDGPGVQSTFSIDKS